MARRYNSLYIGDHFLSEDGREVKHIGLIKEFGQVRVKKTTDEPIKYYGLDIETNHLTGQLKLLGVYNGEKYAYYTKDFIGILFYLIKSAYWNKGETALAYWNKLDPFVLYKSFLLLFDQEHQDKSMKRYGKISGEWDRKSGTWSVRPVIEIELTQGKKVYRFGIKNVIRSSMQFFFYEMVGDQPKQLNNETYPLSQVWAFDIAPLYKYGLAREMGERVDLFPYYSKVSNEAHLVDWDRFNNDDDFKHNIVLRSNRYDAMAVYDLANLLQDSFYKSFRQYPRNLISSGAIARASIVATISNKYYDYYDDKKFADKLIKDDIESIGIQKFFDIWSHQMPDEKLKDMFCLFYEAYSGGFIEAFVYGLIGEGYYSDLASAYVKHITELLDLRGSAITYGEGEPPVIEDSYTFLRGTINVPYGVDYIPLTVKHITAKDTNVRATGEYIGSYTINERDYLITLGATFRDEVWYNIATTGEISPIGEVAQDLTKLRYQLLEEEDTAEFLIKTVTASLYGIMFEATNTYKENIDFNILRDGYRGGEFLNPCYAAWICAETRLQVARANHIIEDNGGMPIMTMTDAVFIAGPTSTMPSTLYTKTKVLGEFETPVKFDAMACLGTGRYSYIKSDSKKISTKNRGLNVVDLHRPDGVELGVYNWIEALKLAEATNSLEIRVKVRMLISVGVVAHTKELTDIDKDGEEIKIPITVKDLGRVIEINRKVDLVTGLTKRMRVKALTDVKDITQGYIRTKPIHYGVGMAGDGAIIDQTLKTLRTEVMKYPVKTVKASTLENRSKASKKYAAKHKEDILKVERSKYQMLKALGYSRDDCKLWCKRSYERINEELLGSNSK